MSSYSHLITVEEKDGSRVIRIDRVFEDGKRDFCTEIKLPVYDEKKKWDLFDQLACSLGKSICIDSVGVRKHLNLD